MFPDDISWYIKLRGKSSKCIHCNRLKLQIGSRLDSILFDDSQMSCFPTSRSPGKNEGPDQGREHVDRGEDEEYKKYRERMRRKHEVIFLPSLNALIALVRNKDRHCEVDEIKKGDLKLLDRVRYFRCLKSLYPSVNFSIDTKKGKVHLKGRGKSFENAFDKCFKQLREIDVVEKSLSLKLDERWKWDIVANMHCQQYFEENMTSNDMMAEITAGNSDDLIVVTALNEIEWQKARKLLDESLIQDVVPIPNGADTSFKSSHFGNFQKEQEKNKPLKIFFRQFDDKETASIQLVGVKDVVVEARKATENFIEFQRERDYELTWKHSEDKFKFLQTYFSELVKPIEDHCQVRIELEHGPQTCKIRWKGLPETFTECKTSLEDLWKKILQKDELIELPGVKQFFNQKGQKQLKLIEEAKRVCIRRNGSRQTNVSDSDAQRSRQQQRFVEGPSSMKAVVVPERSSGNVTISLKHGRIENERAAVLAYSALPDLNDYTVCGQALKLVGGATYIEACKPYTSISPGDIVCTVGGNLACQYVLHVVGCDWKDNKKNNERVVRNLINKCLQKCIDLRVDSLAMSSFGADQHGYKAEDVFEIVLEEVELLDVRNPVQCSLEHVQVVYLKRKHLGWWRSRSSFRARSRSAFRARSRSAFRAQPHPTLLQAAVVTSCTSKFGSVSVVLKEGEITTYEADAIINILSNHLQLSSYNSVCETIIQAGGQSVQDELNRHTRSNHLHSIFKTHAGSIKNVKEILHIIPASPDSPGLQSSLEQCFDFVKALSLRNVLIPVAEIMSLEVSLNCLVQLILVTAENVSIDGLATLEIVVLVAQRSEFDVLKLLFEGERSVATRSTSLISADHVRGTRDLHNVDDVSIVASHVNDDEVFLSQEAETASVGSPNDDPDGISNSREESQINIPASEGDEDKILLRFVGFQSEVNDSISEVMDFVDRNKAKQSIQVLKESFVEKHTKDLEILASIYHVLINLRPHEITVEGVKDNVFECHKKITDLLNKYAKIEEEIKRQLEESNKENKLDTDEDRNDVDSSANLTNISKVRVYSESSASWSWEEKSKAHRKRFQKFLEYGQEHPKEIKEIDGVRFCCSSEEFCIGRGSDGTRVYIGLGKDGYEKAVKRLHKDQCWSLAKHEKQILNEPNTAESKHTVKYWYYDDESDKEFVHLILDLCEETLEEYVERNSREDLLAIAPDIIRQILEGLSDLHQKPTTILHRDLKPSNIMRNMQDRWLLADFGISRTLPPDKDTLVSKPRGNEHWRAVESYSSEESSHESCARYKKESDIQTAGMVAYFIVSKSEHPFGSEAYRGYNLLTGNPVGLNNIKDPALKDLLGWMLSHNPKERPAAKEARKHPYLQPAHEQFELLCTMGNLCEIKTGDSTCEVTRQINSDPKNWRSFMDADVFQYLCIDPKKSTPNRYSCKWTDCLRFIRNANQHWKDPKSISRPKSIEGEPQDYFLQIFPSFPVTVHRILRSCDWKEREEFKRFFT